MNLMLLYKQLCALTLFRTQGNPRVSLSRDTGLEGSPPSHGCPSSCLETLLRGWGGLALLSQSWDSMRTRKVGSFTRTCGQVAALFTRSGSSPGGMGRWTPQGSLSPSSPTSSPRHRLLPNVSTQTSLFTQVSSLPCQALLNPKLPVLSCKQ